MDINGEISMVDHAFTTIYPDFISVSFIENTQYLSLEMFQNFNNR